MKTWRVTITRELSQEHDMEIEAHTEDEACEKAEDAPLSLLPTSQLMTQ
jgi:hypothetical protein